MNRSGSFIRRTTRRRSAPCCRAFTTSSRAPASFTTCSAARSSTSSARTTPTSSSPPIWRCPAKCSSSRCRRSAKATASSARRRTFWRSSWARSTKRSPTESTNLRFILGTEAGMITPIVRQVQTKLRDDASEGGHGALGRDRLSRRKRSHRAGCAKRPRDRAGRGRWRGLLHRGRLRDLPVHEDELASRVARPARTPRRRAAFEPGAIRTPQVHPRDPGTYRGRSRGRANPPHALVPADWRASRPLVTDVLSRAQIPRFADG